MQATPARLLVGFVLIGASCGDDSTGTGAGPNDASSADAPDATSSSVLDLETVAFDTAPQDTLTGTPDGTDAGPRGDFGAPCQGNADCVDGYCVEGPEGFVCTKGCDLECPNGYDCRGVQSGSADTIFLCLPRVARVCVPCKADYQCPNGACLDLAGAGQCTFGCDDASDCPSGYACAADPAATHAGTYCLPRSGSCDCTPDLAGAVRTCSKANDSGTCIGVETCDAEAGWVGCTAATATAEVCDGRDNDCDALVDDGVATNTPCENTVAGVGTCRGVSVCVGTQGLVCTAATPELETCDFRDNDCDGETDEPFKDADGAFTLAAHCGTCNSDCSEKIANGTGRCEIVDGASPVCVVAACDPDYVELNRFQCALPPDVSCLPCQSEAECYDGSCIALDGQRVCVVPCGDSGSCQDGYACQDVAGEPRCVPVSASCLCNATSDGQIRTCVRSSVSGTCYGQEVCAADAGWSGCTARTPSEELCNGIDDDCSAGVDDVIGRGNACTNDNAFGSCPGVRDCVAGVAALSCVGPTPGAEICNYEDDDCDGLVDEDFAGLYASCSSGRGACQRYGFVECRADGSGTQCNAVAGSSADETCDRIDNDCDGSTDEDFPGLGEVCSAGVGACRGFGTRICAPDGGSTACSAVASEAGGELCDLVDNDCDGVTDNGFKNAAGKYANDAACGNCFTDCTVIFARPHGRGACDANQPEPACALVCNAGFFNLNAVPDDGCEFGLDPAAIYVGTDSVAAADDATCGLGPSGTGASHHPCKTVGFGLARAQALARTKVLVADGLYSEQITLISGISVLGGYRADTWDRHLTSTGTTVRGPDGVGDRKAMIAVDITAATIVEGLVINGANAISTGANSYGIYVRNSTGALVIRNNLVFAGLGAPGGTGTIGASGANGVAGSGGRPTKHLGTCTSANNAGGAGGAKSCQDPGLATSTSVDGGKGGDSVCPLRNRQEGSGTTGLNGGGAGGAGGWGHASTTTGCNPSSSGPETGVPGFDATVQANRDGNGGTGCSDDDGTISADGEWRGVEGADATHGAHGGGGGGGGAGSGGVVNSGDNGYDISGSGGGGGSGGCAGSRGGGGSAGGGSFGIFIYWSADNLPSSAAGVPVITNNVLSRNHGGPGGNGGNGGAGGDPGAGALGGALDTTVISSPAYCVFGGAKGGFGARGGHGGGGGGACGGASFDIFAWGLNAQPHGFDGNVFPNGSSVTGGTQGAGGNSSNTTRGGTAGKRGLSGTLRLID